MSDRAYHCPLCGRRSSEPINGSSFVRRYSGADACTCNQEDVLAHILSTRDRVIEPTPITGATREGKRMTQNVPDGNDALMGTGLGLPALKFGEPGDRKVVTVLDRPQSRQEHEYDPVTKRQGKPKVFPSGDPIMGVVVTVQTDERDPEVEEDDGRRTFFIEGKRLKLAIKQAVLAAGERGLAPGGVLDITLTHYDTPGDRRSGRNWTAVYTPPQPGNDALMGPDPWATADAAPGQVYPQPPPVYPTAPPQYVPPTPAPAQQQPVNPVGAAAQQLDPVAQQQYQQWLAQQQAAQQPRS